MAVAVQTIQADTWQLLVSTTHLAGAVFTARNHTANTKLCGVVAAAATGTRVVHAGFSCS